MNINFFKLYTQFVIPIIMPVLVTAQLYSTMFLKAGPTVSPEVISPSIHSKDAIALLLEQTQKNNEQMTNALLSVIEKINNQANTAVNIPHHISQIPQYIPPIAVPPSAGHDVYFYVAVTGVSILSVVSFIGLCYALNSIESREAMLRLFGEETTRQSKEVLKGVEECSSLIAKAIAESEDRTQAALESISSNGEKRDDSLFDIIATNNANAAVNLETLQKQV